MWALFLLSSLSSALVMGWFWLRRTSFSSRSRRFVFSTLMLRFELVTVSTSLGAFLCWKYELGGLRSMSSFRSRMRCLCRYMRLRYMWHANTRPRSSSPSGPSSTVMGTAWLESSSSSGNSGSGGGGRAPVSGWVGGAGPVSSALDSSKSSQKMSGQGRTRSPSCCTPTGDRRPALCTSCSGSHWEVPMPLEVRRNSSPGGAGTQMRSLHSGRASM
mmetsp:Transcript_15369/g.33216  ORF Transcript_15369/g.33216 Transcript_15369/m.33216 type:complete len:216 (+) Transcript_15369:2153-2800(+)